jgi:hypothetical protein
LKLNGTYQVLVYADDVNILGGSVHAIKENGELLVVASKEIGLEIHSVITDNSSFESVEEFKYLETTLTNQNSIQEEIKSRLKSGNVCYHSVQIFFIPVCYPKVQRLRYTEL